jgi:hypothetical protein
MFTNGLNVPTRPKLAGNKKLRNDIKSYSEIFWTGQDWNSLVLILIAAIDGKLEAPRLYLFSLSVNSQFFRFLVLSE